MEMHAVDTHQKPYSIGYPPHAISMYQPTSSYQQSLLTIQAAPLKEVSKMQKGTAKQLTHYNHTSIYLKFHRAVILHIPTYDFFSSIQSVPNQHAKGPKKIVIFIIIIMLFYFCMKIIILQLY